MNLWWRIWFGALVAKFALAAWLPLSPDEAYYWVWSQHLQLSYFDHPPMVALLMKAGQWFPDWQRCVRWPAVALAHAGLWFWADHLKSWLNERQQLWWLILVLLMPLTGPGSLVVTPDLPLMFSWGFMLWSFGRLMTAENVSRWAVVFGVAAGLGFLSKYTAVLFAPVALTWWWSTEQRPPMRSWLPLALLTAAIIAAPVWLWNMQNDWGSFRFQLHHGLGRKVWKPKWTYEYLLTQFGLIFPVVLFFAARARAPRPWLIAAWLPLLFFFFTSFHGYVEVNWPLVTHPMVMALAVRQAGTRAGYWLGPVGGLWALGLIGIIMLNSAKTRPPWVERTKLRDLRELDRLVAVAKDYDPLFTRSYQTAAKLSFDLKRPIHKLAGMTRRDFYDTLPGSVPDGDRFFLIVESNDALPEPWNTWTKNVVATIDERFQILEVKKP